MIGSCGEESALSQAALHSDGTRPTAATCYIGIDTAYGACTRLMIALTKPCFLTMFGLLYPMSDDDECHRRTGR